MNSKPFILTPDGSNTIHLNGTSISGSIGSAVVIKSNGATAYNIAGGAVTGDAYQVEPDLDERSVMEVFQNLTIADAEKEEIKKLTGEIIKQVRSGSDLNFNLVGYVFRYISRFSAPTASFFLDWLLSQKLSPETKEAIRFLGSTPPTKKRK